MKNILKNMKLAAVLFLSLAVLTCEDDDGALVPEIEALFTQTINQETGEVTFINVSSNADSYSWNFGDGTTSNLINPIKTYETGTYTVILTATNAQGASDTFEDTIFIQVPEPIILPITFDNPVVSYDATAFGGVAFAVVENPDASGANSEVSNVGAITNNGAAFEGFFFDLGEPIDLTEDKSIKMKFWSTSPIPVLLKLEVGTGADVETVANHGGTGWEEIYFTLNSAASYSRFTMFVDGPGTTSGTFYMDDVEQINSADVPCPQTELEFPIDFDCNGIDFAAKIVGNVDFTVVDNPELSGINNVETKVGRITNSGEQFENAFFNLDTPADFSAQTGIRMKLFSSQALPILLKFEDGTEADVEDVQQHGGTGWEELTFTLNSTGSYNDMVLFVDGPGTAAGTFYVDDITQVDGTPPPPPFDDGLLTNGDFQTLDGDGNVVAWIQGVDDNNPAPVVTVGGNTYYSINITTPTPGSPFNINVSQKVEIVQGTTYILSFEAWSSVNRSIIAGIGLSGGDFSNASETVNITTTPTVYQRTYTATGFGAPDARVLFDLAEEAGVVNIDNVSLFASGGGGGGGGGGDGTCPAPPAGELLSNGNFEAGAVCWQLFAGSSISTTINNGGSNSGQLQGSTGVAVGIKQERFAAGQILPNTSYTVTFDIIASAALGEGGLIKSFTFSEGVDGGNVGATQHVLTDNLTSVSTTSWESKSFTFTTPSQANQVEGGLSFLFEIVNSAARINIDNVVVKKTP